MKSSRKGIGLIEAVVGVGLILTGVAAGFTCLIFMKKAIIEIQARTEWRAMNFNLDMVLSDTLLCEKTNLTRVGDPNRFLALSMLASPGKEEGTDLYSPTAIAYHAGPTSPATRLAEVGHGHAFELSTITVAQVTPPAGQYTNVSGVRSSIVHTIITLTGKIRSALGRGSPLRYTHRINFEVNTTNPADPTTYLRAISCYAAQSRRRTCEQLSLFYDPANPTPAQICK